MACSDCMVDSLPEPESIADAGESVKRAVSKIRWDADVTHVAYGLGGLVGLFVVAALIWGKNRPKPADDVIQGPTPMVESNSRPRAGSLTTVGTPGGGIVPVAADAASFNEMNAMSAADDDTGLQLLQLTGRLWVVPSGTQVKVLSPGFQSYEVRILSGPHALKSGVVASEHVAP